MKTRVGLQLYTLREYLQNPEDFRKTMKRVADAGYKAVQLSGAGDIAPEEITESVKDNGLRITATHVGWNELLGDIDSVIHKHQLWNCDHTAIGILPEEYRNLDGMKRFLYELPPVSEKLSKAGIDLSYHNHSHEFVRYDGKTWLELLYEKTDPRHLKAELDTYWIQHGGGDPAQWIRKYKNRQPILHLKDMAISEDGKQRFAEIGEGNLNWKEIFSAVSEAGVEWMFVEQDTCYERSPFESIAMSYSNLRSMGVT